MRLSSANRQAHVELWRDSGLSRAEYCRRAGLAYHQLTAWLQRDGQQRGRGDAAAADDFLLIRDRPVRDEPTPGDASALVVLAGGIRLRFGSGCAARWVAQVLAELRGC